MGVVIALGCVAVFLLVSFIFWKQFNNDDFD